MQNSNLTARALVIVGLSILLDVSAIGAEPAEKPASASKPFKPQFDKCTLTLDGKSLPVRAVRNPWSPQYQTGNMRLTIRDDQVTALEPLHYQPLWSIKSGDGRRLQWLAGDDKAALFLGWSADAQRNAVYDSPLRLRRLDLVKHTWLSALPLPVDKKSPKQVDRVTDVIAGHDHFAVLTSQFEPDESPDGARASGYQISFFAGSMGQADKPIWTQTFPSNGVRPAPGVRLWASVMPDYATSHIRHLSWLGSDLLVCGGEKEDILCLDSTTGKTKWRVNRLWHYQRGFFGPSVWQHFISPCGVSGLSVDLMRPGTPPYEIAAMEDEKRLAPLRAELDKQFHCAIVGGPVIVPGPGDNEKQRTEFASLFVAVAKGPGRGWGYVSDCVIYELSGDGNVIGMANLPRMVNGGEFTVDDKGLVWACQQAGMVRIGRRRGSRTLVGPGGSDLLCDIVWYRQFSADPPKAWLSADRAKARAAFARSDAIITVGGGYVKEKARQVYEFPLTFVDLKTGADRNAILSVPFDGDLPTPKTNFSGGDDHISTLGPCMLGVTGFRVDGTFLEITLGMEGSAAGIAFDLDLLK